MPNVDELIRVREWARDQHKLKLAGLPSEWDQYMWLATNLDTEKWTCGSASCIAGKTVLNAGAEPLWSCNTSTVQVRSTSTSLVLFDGEEWDVSVLAAKLLDISWEQSDILFSASNSFQEVEYIIDAVIADPDWNWSVDDTFVKMLEMQ